MKSFNVFAANTYGARKRSIQRFDARNHVRDYEENCGYNIIDIDVDDTIIISYLTKFMKNIRMKSITGKGSTADNPITFSMCIDASKLAQGLVHDSKNHAIVGGAYITGCNNHFIQVNNENGTKSPTDITKELLSIIQKHKEDERNKKKLDITEANEVKVAIIVLQDVGVDICPFLAFFARPQTTNEKSDFNERCCNICCKLVHNLKIPTSHSAIAPATSSGTASGTASGSASATYCHFLGCCNDGVTSDSTFVKKSLCSFVKGDTSYVSTLDNKHILKSLRYQCVLGGNYVKFIGRYIIHIGLLTQVNIPCELLTVTDWANDVLVQQLISYNTVTSLVNEFSLNDCGSLVITIVFLRMHLFAMNFTGKYID